MFKPALPALPRSVMSLPSPVLQAGLAIRSLGRRLVDRPLPADVALFDLSMGFATLVMMNAVVGRGIPDAIGPDGATAARLADDLGLDADATHRVLRCLATSDVVRLGDDGRFHLTRIGRLLRSDDPESLAPWIRYLSSEATQAAWRALDDTLADGEPGFPKANGMSLWDWFADNPTEGAQFGTAMARLTGVELPAIVAAYPWPRRGVVCDVAGGHGALLSAVLRQSGDLTGVIVDRAEQIAGAITSLDKAGLGDRAKAQVGDIFSVIDVAADVYLLKDILHDWSDSACLRILRTIRAAAPPGSKLLVIEMPQPENTPAFPASVADVHMMTQTDGGRQRSVAALEALLTEAGFDPRGAYAAVSYSLISAQA